VGTGGVTWLRDDGEDAGVARTTRINCGRGPHYLEKMAGMGGVTWLHDDGEDAGVARTTWRRWRAWAGVCGFTMMEKTRAWPALPE